MISKQRGLGVTAHFCVNGCIVFLRGSYSGSMKIQTMPPELAPGGHYSHLVEANGFYFVSGQLPTGLPATSTIEEQFAVVIERTRKILATAGLGLENVAKSTIYITDVNLWPKVNALYAEAFGSHRPARAIVPVPDLHYGYKLEIEMVAVK